MFCDVSTRVLVAARSLGVEGLNLPPAPEDDGSILCFFCQLSKKLVEATTKVAELIDAECRELLGLAGMHIFSNL
jgi:hypothetical protein